MSRAYTIVGFGKGVVSILDQRALPHRVKTLRCRRVEQVARAIETEATRAGRSAVARRRIQSQAAAAARAWNTFSCTGEGGFPPALNPYDHNMITQVATGFIIAMRPAGV